MATDTYHSDVEIIWKDKRGTVLDLSALQGDWTEEQYLLLSNRTNRLIEFTDGEIEVLPMPTDHHQSISRFLFLLLFNFLQGSGGHILYSPLRVLVRPGKFREPDLVVLLDANDARRQNTFWLGADFVVEIVSPDNPERDIVEKRADYAEAGIPEYWIINLLDETISVLIIEGNAYVERSIFRRGETATSQLLVGFSVSVDEVFDAR